MLKVPENNTHPIRTATVSFIIDFVRLHWILRMVNATTDITHPFFRLGLGHAPSNRRLRAILVFRHVGPFPSKVNAFFDYTHSRGVETLEKRGGEELSLRCRH